MQIEILNHVSFIRVFFVERLDVISFAFALFSILLSIYFWKNPLSLDIINKRPVYNHEGEVEYILGENDKGWVVKKINMTSEDKSGERMVFVATIKNNKGLKNPPETIDELSKLNYR